MSKGKALRLGKGEVIRSSRRARIAGLRFGTRRIFGLTRNARSREHLQGSPGLYGLLRASLLTTRSSTAFPALDVRLLAGIFGVSNRRAGGRQDSIRQFS